MWCRWSILSLFPPQEFSFPQVWCSNQQPLYCAFSLERYSPVTAQLSCKISVRQVKGHEQILQVYTAVAEVRLWSCGEGVSLFSLNLFVTFLECVHQSRTSSPELELCINRARRALFLPFFPKTRSSCLVHLLCVFLTSVCPRGRMFRQIAAFTFTYTNTWELPAVTTAFYQLLNSSTGAARSQEYSLKSTLAVAVKAEESAAHWFHPTAFSTTSHKCACPTSRPPVLIKVTVRREILFTMTFYGLIKFCLDD